MKKILIMLLSVLFITGCTNDSDKVVIYSSMEENRNQALKEQLADNFPDIKVVVQSLSTGNSAAKIKNEKSNIEADIVIDLETAHMENLKEYFADVSSYDTSMYIDGMVKSNNYLPFVKYTMSLIIDVDYFNKNKLEIPKTYEDLLKPEYKDLIAMPDPKASGTGYAFYLNVVNIMGEKDAIEYFKKLKNNLREFTTSGSGPTNLLKQGEIAIALGMTSQGVSAINEGYNYKLIELSTGSPYNTTSFGIIKGKETDDNVKEIFSWILNDFVKYDIENFMPDTILKEQENKVENYPQNLIDADMKNIDSIDTKNKLIEKWSEVNG